MSGCDRSSRLSDVDRLEVENQQLRDRVRTLEDMIYARLDVLQRALKLTRTEAKMLCALTRCEVVHRSLLMDELYGLRLQPPDEKIVDLYLCRIRKKLRPLGVEINTCRSAGWFITDSGKAILEQLREQWTTQSTDQPPATSNA